MLTCIYCGNEKEASELSDEHIWPSAIGGDHLSDLWRTNMVCKKCNNMSGLFVDGAFTKGMMGDIERSVDRLIYLDKNNRNASIPLIFLGTLQEKFVSGEVIDFWVCAPGANIYHFRENNSESIWDSFSGGDPRRKKMKDCVFVYLTSSVEFWIQVAINSVVKHFSDLEIVLANVEFSPRGNKSEHQAEPSGTEIPENEIESFFDTENVRAYDPAQRLDQERDRFIKNIGSDRVKGGKHRLHTRKEMTLDFDRRFMAKVGLALGYKLFGNDFLNTDHAKTLRSLFREASYKKRQKIPLLGKPYLGNICTPELSDILAWPCGWTLLLRAAGNHLSLFVATPNQHLLSVIVTPETSYIDTFEKLHPGGLVFLTIPPAQTAVGPIAFNDFVEHSLGTIAHPGLKRLASLQRDPRLLPDTGIRPPNTQDFES